MRKGYAFIISLSIGITGLLHGCMNVATSGAQAVYNRHSIQKNVGDQLTTVRVYQALNFKSNQFRNANIAITTYNGEVLLAGQAPFGWQRDKAEQITKQVSGVTKVYNLVTVGNPISSLTHVSDSWITTKVKSKLISSSEVDASQIKVVTENGSVYLMGTVPANEADAAVDIARRTAGVERVVKIFSYITITKKPLNLHESTATG